MRAEGIWPLLVCLVRWRWLFHDVGTRGDGPRKRERQLRRLSDCALSVSSSAAGITEEGMGKLPLVLPWVG